VVPDAWDDDWESQADKIEEITDSTKAEEQVKISKAERLAQHAETNKKIWESAYDVLSLNLSFYSNSALTETLRKPFISWRRKTASLLQQNSNRPSKSSAANPHLKLWLRLILSLDCLK